MKLKRYSRFESQPSLRLTDPIKLNLQISLSKLPMILFLPVSETHITSDTELNAPADNLNADLSPGVSDVSKFVDEPMLADAPNIDTDVLTPAHNREIVANIRDMINNMSDTFSDKSKDRDKTIGQAKEMLNATSNARLEKSSINNENLNPLPPSSFENKSGKNASEKRPNTLVNNIRKSMETASQVMMNNEINGNQAEVTSEMAQIKRPTKSSRIKIGKGALVDEELDPSTESSDKSIFNGSSTGNSSSGNGINSLNMTSASANISTTLRNVTYSQMAHSLVNETVQGRATLKARNSGSKPILMELQKSGWLTLVAMVSLVSRF